jgi:hypothetical protein
MNAQHTPGPWEVVVTTDGITVPNWHIQIGEVKVPAFPYKRIYSEDRTQSGLVQDDEQVANIRLIAAAPELLSVLSEFKTASDKQEITFDGGAWLERVDAAIAKATGGGV